MSDIEFLILKGESEVETHVISIYEDDTIENVKNPSDEYPKHFANKLVKLTKNYKAVKNLYPVDGTDQDYFYFR